MSDSSKPFETTRRVTGHGVGSAVPLLSIGAGLAVLEPTEGFVDEAEVMLRGGVTISISLPAAEPLRLHAPEPDLARAIRMRHERVVKRMAKVGFADSAKREKLWERRQQLITSYWSVVRSTGMDSTGLGVFR